MIRRWRSPLGLASILLISAVTSSAWIARESLHGWLTAPSGGLPAVVAGVSVWMLAGGGVLLLERAASRSRWLDHAERRTGLSPLGPAPLLERLRGRLVDPLEWLASPLAQTRIGRRWQDDWREAGFGEKLSRFLLLILFAGALGGLIGQRIAGPLLAIGMTLLLPIVPIRLVASLAENQRKRFGEQVPAALDAIAAGLAAGLSFPSAVAFAADELPHPIAAAMQALQRRMQLGHSVGDSLAWLLDRHPDEEGLNLAADGVILQRRLGGDLVRMLEETAAVVRERVELEREVRAVTAQGRLSGWVVGGLVPVSAVILLLSNPRYIDVLFNTLPGQALLVLALLLQLVGWLIISRLVQLDY